MTHIVAFTGPMFSGKDTACAHLIDVGAEHGLTVVRKGFADALKTSAARALGAPMDWDVDQYREYCDKLKEGGSIHVRVATRREISNDTGAVSVYHDTLTPPEGLSGRQYLQYYGTEAHRDVFGGDFWIDAVLPRPDEPGQDYEDDGVDVLAISDCRFPNEAQRIVDLNGSVVRVVRGEVPGDPATATPVHVSEAGVPEELVTHTIYNNGEGPETLRPAVESLARLLDLIS